MEALETTTFFNEIYDNTYKKVLRYVISKCGNISDVSDIIQETYIELYTVLNKRGMDYIQNSDAFIMQIAKAKIYRHYTMSKKIKDFIPLFIKTDSGQEISPVDFEISNDTVEDEIVNKALIENITAYISKKPDDIQKIFCLYYEIDLTIIQIAAELSISQSNVKNKLYRTVKEIRELYRKGGEFHE
ncbi:MAG: RNA polymerase sigma factor [Saccharofermentanales bacterium]